MRFVGNKIFVVLASVLVGVNASGAVELGIDVTESNGYALLKNPAAAGDLPAVNIYALAEMNRQLRTNLITRSSSEKREMFFKCRGSSAFQFAGGIAPARIVASWSEDVTGFKGERSQYLLY
jgi:hypothetical protein